MGIVFAISVVAIPFLRKKWGRRSYLCLSILLGLILVVLWLGSYSYSPLEYFGEQNLREISFLVTRSGRVNEPVASGETITLKAGSPAAIAVLSAVPTQNCQWMSLNHGAWDDANNCDTTYAAPDAEFDILTLNVELACGLPSTRAQIKVSILP